MVMGRIRKIVSLLFSKTVAAGILGFLLSLFATEILFAVPAGMEPVVAGLLLMMILPLLIHVAGFFDELKRRWWDWRRIIIPIRVAILDGFFDDSKEGTECELQFQPNSGWLVFFREKAEKKQFEVEQIHWLEISSKYAIIVNPFGEIYVEGDKRNLVTYEKIKEFVAEGGIFCCTGGFPFYYYWNPIIERPIDTTPRTRTTQGDLIEDNRYFTDSLVTQDFGAIITNDPREPTLIRTYQEREDIEFFGNLSGVGGTDIVWEFRSLSKETRGLIPGLRVKHENEVKFPLAAITYGKGYLIVAGMALKRTEIEFEKLGKGLVAFTNEIVKRRKSKRQTQYEDLTNKLRKFIHS
jgi:hypothetical protein